MQFKLIALLALAVASVNGAVSGTCTCGSNYYTGTKTQAAITKARSGGTFGRNKYPHQYKGLDAGVSFTCSKPWNEFPVLKSGAVFDGSTGPGPDRVVYDASGGFCGCITHTGASGNGFKKCT